MSTNLDAKGLDNYWASDLDRQRVLVALELESAANSKADFLRSGMGKTDIVICELSFDGYRVQVRALDAEGCHSAFGTGIHRGR